MLVLTRKSDESLRIGDDITITVVEIKGNSVRLGIRAPAHMRIYREELYEKIRKENIMSLNISLEGFEKINKALRTK